MPSYELASQWGIPKRDRSQFQNSKLRWLERQALRQPHVQDSWRLCENSRSSKARRRIFQRKLNTSTLTLNWATFRGSHGRTCCFADAAPSFHTVCMDFATSCGATLSAPLLGAGLLRNKLAGAAELGRKVL